MKEIIKPFLSKSIKVCDKCGKIDINTYARYKLQDDKYILDSAYSKCQKCGGIRELTKNELKEEVKGR